MNTSEVLWTNIVKEWYYEVVITQIVVGGTIVDVPCSALNNDKTIVDSGTTNLRLPTPVYHKVLSLIKVNILSCTTVNCDFYQLGMCRIHIRHYPALFEVSGWIPDIFKFQGNCVK